jgi:glycosyltransferase involved in cell wall biosynthesis
MPVKISAIVCTYNREKYLHKTIKSLLDQNLDKDLYEIIIIDNGTGTETSRLIKEKFSSADNLYYYREPVVGLSNARNMGWVKSRGEYIAYIDDDAIAHPDWLQNIITAFENVSPSPGIVGGRVKPIWESPRPAWFSDLTEYSLSLINWSDSPIFIDSTKWLVGTNISFPRKLIEDLGGFDAGLGRMGRSLLSMEENLLRIKAEEKGYLCYYDPKIIVNHHIPCDRLTKKWFMRRAWWQGISEARMDFITQKKTGMKRSRLLVRQILKLLMLMYDIRHILHYNISEFTTLVYLIILRIGYIAGMSLNSSRLFIK